MTVSAFHIAAAIWPVLEFFALTAAAYLFFRRRRYTLAEAAAYAVISVFFALSFWYQAAALVGLPWVARLADLGLTAVAVAILAAHRRLWFPTARTISRMMREHRLATVSLAVVWGYLLLQAVILPPDSLQWHELGRHLLCQTQTGLIAGAQVQSAPAGLGCGAPVNQAVLTQLFLGTPTDIGIGLPGFWAYSAIGFATYALSRRYAWPATSLTVTLVVVSMPRFVCLATTAGSEIIVAATVVFCLLAAYRAIERPNMIDLSYLVCGIPFSLAPHRHGATHVLLLTVLAAILLFRRHGTQIWTRMVVDHRHWLLPILPVLLVFSHAWAWGGAGSAPAGLSQTPTAFNPDGIQGMLANLVRYLFETAHFTRPVDLLCDHVFGFKLSALLQHLQDRLVVTALGNPGTSLKMQLRWIPDARHAWFGPFGLLLTMPAVAYALRRAPRRLKTIALALAGYWLLTALILAWHPRNAGFFSIFFGCSGACMALFLSPWRISRRGRRNIQLAAIVLLLYTAGFNPQKPLIGPIGSPSTADAPPLSFRTGRFGRGLESSIWHPDRGGLDRLSSAGRYFGDNRVAHVAAEVGRTANVVVFFDDVAPVYPFWAALPDGIDWHFRPLPVKRAAPMTTAADTYLLCLGPAAGPHCDTSRSRLSLQLLIRRPDTVLARVLAK